MAGMEVIEARWTPPPLVAVEMGKVAPSKRFSRFRSLSGRIQEEAPAKEIPNDLEEGELPWEEGQDRCLGEQGMIVTERVKHIALEDQVPAVSDSTLGREQQSLADRKRSLERKVEELFDRQQGIKAAKDQPKKRKNDQSKDGIEEQTKKQRNRGGSAEGKKRKNDQSKDGIEEQPKKQSNRGGSAEGKKRKKKIKRADKERSMGIVRRRPVFKQIEKPPKPPIPCKFFMKAACTKGDKCPFSHKLEPDTKKYMCKYFLTNCCLKGDECSFSHDTSKFPCKFFVSRGYCSGGEKCRFSHDPVSDEQREKILQRIAEERKKSRSDPIGGGAAGGVDGGALPKVDEVHQVAEAAAAAAPEYDPDWKDFSSAPMDEDNFMFRAARQAALEQIDGGYDPSPVEWWKSNNYGAAPPAAEDSFLARQAAALREGEGPSSIGDEVMEECDSGRTDEAEDELLLKAARQPAAIQCSNSARPSSRTSFMDQLQQSLKESGAGIFF